MSAVTKARLCPPRVVYSIMRIDFLKDHTMQKLPKALQAIGTTYY